MPPLEPDKKVGYITNSMVVVICPVCRKKRWANLMKGLRKARTTCCGHVMEV